MRALALAGLLVLAAPPGALPPRPIVVEAAPDAAPGRMGLDPPVVWVTAAPGESAQPLLTLTNGGSVRSEFELAVRAVLAGDDGAPEPGSSSGGRDSAGDWVTLPADRVVLGPSELARIWPSINVPGEASPGSRTAALLASAESERVVALLVVDVRGPDEAGPGPIEVDADLALERGSTGLLTVTLDALEDSSAHAVSGRVRVRSWTGRVLLDAELPSTLVLPGTVRRQTFGFRGPTVPGPASVEVRLRERDGSEVSATASAFLANPALVGSLAALLIVVTAASGIVVLRRRSLPSMPPSGEAGT